MKKLVLEITYRCEITVTDNATKEEMDQMVDRTSVVLCTDHGGDMIDVSISNINYAPEHAPGRDYWIERFGLDNPKTDTTQTNT